MKLTALQLPARFDAREEQLALATALLQEGPSTDVVLLPEASLTGYVSPQGQFDLKRFAEALHGPTREALTAMAKRFGCLVVGPLIEREGDHCFNSMLGITPEGVPLLHYRKRHPWYPEMWATGGTRVNEVISWRGRRFMAAICFDAHFLEEDASAALDQADVLLFPSAWVDRIDSRTPLLSGIAWRHRIAILNANWGGGLPLVEGQGGTLFIDNDGHTQKRLSIESGRLDITLP